MRKIVSTIYLFSFAAFLLNTSSASAYECVNKDFRKRMGPPRSQQSESTCWAFTSTKLFEEQLCLENGMSCGLELSVADIMRCKFSLGYGAPERATHCALDFGICEESQAPYPFGSNSMKPFETLWGNPTCKDNRRRSTFTSNLVVRGNPITVDPDGMGLKPGDDFIEKTDMRQAVLQAFNENRSSNYIFWFGLFKDQRHAVVLNAMRLNADKTCDVFVQDTTDIMGTGWHNLDKILEYPVRLTWIRSSSKFVE